MAKEENVFLFVPNVIGYVRIVAGILAFYYSHSCGLFWTCYFVSYFLDCIDGFAARYFGQATRFGQMLDMVTDRCCSACLFLVLAGLYPSQGFGFNMLLALDISSHYARVYSQLLGGISSHKSVDKQEVWLLRMYYGSQKVLFILCFLNESFFVILYVLAFNDRESPLFAARVRWLFEPVCLYVCAPGMVIKQLCNLLQLLSACGRIADYDKAARIAQKAQ
uniref:CDP-diacylglycerol--inositol 3-phosphatidyltransferase n=1 Tax=Hemiselmis andersenii TaxID=464988 RepID=A0A6U2DK63_HEMAN|mmetsp:Transcript_23644/g.54970  ORF Transcript_23644/g.54970 Transcript_23644/m.54970 type:complete len:221 (+) Transcript_23644:86-748(+)|eukprot:CAMPEP_0114144972 /NCGR_PEP_ID=MMETSP0043_2-20121206/19808_1 /TAXON_ID=464988 /ORGANISM="Hemiselmis andersenii, Strain CCMP644" /LENGTH=220 /DNA_ID=CAMNT_0001239379 /DNA_START=86 /DNA_END=748 /DNA_ORIENTATION=-